MGLDDPVWARCDLPRLTITDPGQQFDWVNSSEQASKTQLAIMHRGEVAGSRPCPWLSIR
jgi:hypothetical protein